MANVAAQVILHPVATQTLNVLGTTLGRDKVYRSVQYFSRFLAWYLISNGHSVEGARWNAVKNALASGRKLMRIGKPLEHMQAALKSTRSFAHPGESITTFARQISYAGYLTYDAIFWAGSVRALKLSPETTSKVAKNSYRFWLAGIAFSITNYLLKAGRLANEVKQLRNSKSGEKDVGSEAERTSKAIALERNRAAARYQFIIDLFDIWIPAANLGLVNFNDGVLGIFGFISSVMALRSQWATVNKIKTA